MKRGLLIICISLVSLALQAQVNPVDEMFNKYSGQEGITSVSISGKMFAMFASADLGDPDLNSLMKQLQSVRIITVDSALLNKKLNFNDELGKKLNPTMYEELMVVKDGKKVTRFLTSGAGKTISELVVVSGGTEGNELISLKGNIDLKNISALSSKMGIDQLKSLELIDSKTFK